MSHLKRLAAPKTYWIMRREEKYTTHTSPGPHSEDSSIPLLIALRDLLKVVSTAKEAEKILNERKIMVDGRVITNTKFPVGFMDVIKVLDSYYRVIFDFKGRIKLIQIPEDEANLKISKVVKKKTTKGGKTQVTTEDGRNFIVEDVKTGDSILFTIPKQEVKEVLKMNIGKTVFLIAGKYVGKVAKILEIIPYKMAEDRIVLESNGKKFETLKKYAVVIGNEKPILKVVE